MAENHNNEAAKQEEWLRALEEEVTSVLEQIGVSSKRNVVESFVSLKNKVFLCGRYHYMLKLLVGGTETFIKKRKIELKEEFDRDDYLGAADMKDKFAETNVMRRMNQKFQLVREFIDVNGAVFDRYESDLHTEQFGIAGGAMDAIQSYMVELKEHHMTADNLLSVYLKLQKRAKISKEAVQLLDSFNQEKHGELKRLGKTSEIKGLPITRIELFKNGDIYCAKVKCEDQGQNRGWLATLESSKVNINQNLLDWNGSDAAGGSLRAFPAVGGLKYDESVIKVCSQSS